MNFFRDRDKERVLTTDVFKEEGPLKGSLNVVGVPVGEMTR